MKIIRLITLVLILPIFQAAAHQPILAISDPHTKDNPFLVEKPEISKAIYTRLSGQPHYYQIDSSQPFDFYSGITKPKLDDCEVGKTFSLELLDDTFTILAIADGSKYNWRPWFEEFGRKWYWVGPEIGDAFRSTMRLEAGTYYIRVYNSANQGNYVLATGDVESFPIGVITRMMRDLPKINRIFWSQADCQS